MMETSERIEMLQDAQELLREARQLIKWAVRGTDFSNNAEAYAISAIDMVISNDHDWLSGNPGNIEELIESLENSEVGYEQTRID